MPCIYLAGCSGPMAARMAIMKAARQLALEANVHVHIRKFCVINQAYLYNSNSRVVTRDTQRLRYVCVFVQVGAVGIDAKLNCDAFASTHSATSHYDRASFVGLAWRPGGEQICCGESCSVRSNSHDSTAIIHNL